ncbi:ATP-binding protein [Halolamina salina]|uniref:AAA ATPase domain-containing protein n=1 Tax=Halolamina salina TaxID=1220023 RepID=A0ABD6BA89_9EURY
MSQLPSFIDRQEELRTVFDGIESSSGSFYSIVGPSGHGKTRFLEEIRQQYADEDDVFVLDFQFNSGLTSIKQFGAEFQERWKEEVPSGKTKRAKQALHRVIRSKYTDPAIDLLSAGGGAVVPGLSTLSVGKHLLPEEDSDSNVPLYGEILTDFLGEFSNLNPDCTLLVLLDHYDRVEARQEEFDRLFKSLSRDLPENVVFCVGSQRRLATEHDIPITTVELGEFDTEETEAYLSEAGLDPSEEEISEVVEVTKGNPYYLNRFASIAVESSVESALNDLPESQIHSYLESEFLNELAEDQERLLRNICALSEFRRDIVSKLIGEDTTKTRRELQSLYRESVLEKIGHHSYPVYKPHDLLHDYLRNSISEERLAEQHRECATIYANDVTESPLIDVLEDFLWDFVLGSNPNSEAVEEFARTTGDRFATGVMVDLHLDQVPTKESKEQQLVNLLQDPAVNEDEAETSLSLYYSGQEDVDWSDVTERANGDDQSSKPVEEILETETDKPPEKTLVTEVARAVTLAGSLEDHNKDDKIEKTFEEITETIRRLTTNQDIHLVAGLGYLISKLAEAMFYDSIGETNKEDTARNEAKQFIQDFYGLSQDDYIFCKNLLKTLDYHLQNPDLDISVDPESDLEQAIETRGVYGGAQSGFRSMIVELASDLNQARQDNDPLIQDRQTLKDASREAAIYFANEDHDVIAAVIRDLGNLVEYALSSDGVASKDDIDYAFEDTEFADQLDHVFSTVEWHSEE